MTKETSFQIEERPIMKPGSFLYPPTPATQIGVRYAARLTWGGETIENWGWVGEFDTREDAEAAAAQALEWELERERAFAEGRPEDVATD